MSDHVHEWKPQAGWVGRYRCETCRALGWKRIVRFQGSEVGFPQKRDEKAPFEIVPYKCTKPKCGKDAVTHNKSVGQFCKDHQTDGVR